MFTPLRITIGSQPHSGPARARRETLKYRLIPRGLETAQLTRRDVRYRRVASFFQPGSPRTGLTPSRRWSSTIVFEAFIGRSSYIAQGHKSRTLCATEGKP